MSTMAIAIGVRQNVSVRRDDRATVRLGATLARWFARANTATVMRVSIVSTPDDLNWLDIGDV